MFKSRKSLWSIGVAAVSVVSAAPALAAGTLAGTSIVNTATVNFQVGGVAQTAVTASNTVAVDRKVNLVLTNTGVTTPVSPGQTNAVTTWTITNSSNDTLDFALAASVQATGQTAQHGGTTSFLPSLTNVKYYRDPNNTGSITGSGVTLVTYLDEIAPDATINLLVVADIPLTATNTQIGGLILTGTAQAGGTSGTQGAVLTCNNASANTVGIDNVCAEAAGALTGDVAFDGRHSAKGDYTVAAPVLSVNKVMAIISDPVVGTSVNAKAIPGAVVEYCIVVANAAGGATVTNLSVGDPLPQASTSPFSPYVAYTVGSNNIWLNATVTGSGASATCAGGTQVSGDAGFTAQSGATPANISGALSNLTAGSSTGLRFRVTIQ
jgi:hypothetical protein